MRGGAHAKHGDDDGIHHHISVHLQHADGIGENDVEAEKQAVIWIKKASNGSINWVIKCSKEQYGWYLLFKKMGPWAFWAKVGLVVLTFFELPATCKGTAYECAHADYAVYSWNLPSLSTRLRMAIALCLYLFISCRLYVRAKARGEKYEFRGWYMFNAIVCSLGTIFCVVTLMFPNEGSLYWLITVLCRPLLFLGGMKKLRVAATDIARSVKGYAVVLAALFLTIWVFIWMHGSVLQDLRRKCEFLLMGRRHCQHVDSLYHFE
jgi:hypothetical protein